MSTPEQRPFVGRRIVAAAAVTSFALWIICNVVGAAEYQPLSLNRPVIMTVAPVFLVVAIVLAVVYAWLFLVRRR
jgi:Kef-type K+ transport system membrane component KefB